MYQSRRFIRFVNSRASTESEVVKEAIDELCYYHDNEEFTNQNSTSEYIRQLDTKSFKLIIKSVNNIYSFMNTLLEKNNIILSKAKWNECEILLFKYLELFTNHYLEKRASYISKHNLKIKSIYTGTNICYYNKDQVYDHLRKYNLRQFRIMKDTYGFNRQSISFNSYYLSIIALLISIVSLIISLS